jgi:hypothetical protein
MVQVKSKLNLHTFYPIVMREVPDILLMPAMARASDVTIHSIIV